MEILRKILIMLVVIHVTRGEALNFNSTEEDEKVFEKTTMKSVKIDRLAPDPCGFETPPKTQLQLFKQLTDPCRFDRIDRPTNFDKNGNEIPVDYYIRAYVFYMQNLDTHELQFKLQMRFQVRYKDPRLKFANVGSNITESIIGEEDLKKELWTPHVYFVNEKSSVILGTQNNDILTSIHPDGTVIISSRIQVGLYCSMNFRKFPFDQQECKSTIASWMLNASEVKLHWENESPFTFGSDKILTEYSFKDIILEESEIDATNPGMQYGDFIGNYSSIIFKVTLKRQVGYYLLEYYFPSILIIASSWVTFWLQADQTPPRTMLGVTSMLTFITLSTSQTRSLPKVSYIKASEIWFIVCVLFIFASFVEFAFVNLLWRRKKHLEVGKVTTRNLLKKTLTPVMMRKNYQSQVSSESGGMRKSASDTSINVDKEKQQGVHNSRRNSELPRAPQISRKFETRLSVDQQPTYMAVDGSTESVNEIVVKIPTINENGDIEPITERTEISHQDVAKLLDKRARVAFPCAFLVFNIFYWIFVNI